MICEWATGRNGEWAHSGEPLWCLPKNRAIFALSSGRLGIVHNGRLPRITQRLFPTECAKKGINQGRGEKVVRGIRGSRLLSRSPVRFAIWTNIARSKGTCQSGSPPRAFAHSPTSSQAASRGLRSSGPFLTEQGLCLSRWLV